MIASLTIAFVAGVVSFLSPCIFPVVPGFLAYLAGTSAAAGGASRRTTFLNAACFVAGFTVVFAVLGILLQTALVTVAYDIRIWLSRIGGLAIAVLGLYLTGLVHIPFLDREHIIRVSQVPGRSRLVTSALFGAAFAAGWTPCIGAVLGAILTLAVTQPGIAFALLIVYGAGLGLPFLIVGLFAAAAQNTINRFARASETIMKVFGLLLIVVGVLVFMQRMATITNFGLFDRILLRY